MTAVYSAAQIVYSPVQRPEFARVMDSVEAYGMDRQSYNEKQLGSRDWDVRSVPDVWRYAPANAAQKPDFVRMDETFQHWLFQINLERYIGRRFFDGEYRAFWEKELEAYKKNREASPYITWWNQLFHSGRAFTNKAGVDQYKNYIAGENLDADFPKYFHIITGRFVGKLVHSDRMINGTVHSGMECIDISRPYTDIHPFTHPHLFDQPIVTGRDVIFDKGGYQTVGYWWRIFHQFGQQVVIPFCLPHDWIAYYPKDRLIIPSDTQPLKKS